MLASARRSALLFVSPSAAVNGGRISPKGRAHDVRAFAVGAGGAVGEPRPTFTHPQGRMPGGRRCWGALLFGYFLLGKQEKVTRSQGCEWNMHGCGSVIAKDAMPATRRSTANNAPRKHPHPTLLLQAGGKAKATLCCDRLSQRHPARPGEHVHRRHLQMTRPCPARHLRPAGNVYRRTHRVRSRLCESIPRLALSAAMRRAALHARRGGATVDPSTLLYAGACARRPWPASSKPSTTGSTKSPA